MIGSRRDEDRIDFALSSCEGRDKSNPNKTQIQAELIHEILKQSTTASDWTTKKVLFLVKKTYVCQNHHSNFGSAVKKNTL
jgi:hypothetical protein